MFGNMQDKYELEEVLLIVLVIYQIKIDQSPSFNSLVKASSQKPIELVIYDNSKSSQSIPATKWKIIYHHDPTNPGVSKAYNEGFKIAKQLNKKWLLLVDQDTEFPTTIFSDYAHAVKRYPQVTIFSPLLSDSKGLVSPFKLRWGKGIRTRAVNKTINSLRELKIINSGMLISLTAFKTAGGYDEQFPLDFSDIAFLDRVCKNDVNFALIGSRCYHHLSSEGALGLSDEIDRFKSFCNAVRLYKQISIGFVSFNWVIFPRAFKLFLRSWDFKFLKTWIMNLN
jgi:rhamnosyltransferase